MTIERVIVKNYRVLRSADINLDPEMNIVVGDNESGKSTLLEAINLALRCQLNRRPAAYELHPFLFNVDTVDEFISSYKEKKPKPAPEILIELYLADDPEYAELKGINNSEGVDRPGISLQICLDEDFLEEYDAYVADPDKLKSIPIDFYRIVWLSFAGHPINSRALPLRSAMIDPSAISNTYAANKYVLDVIRDYLTKKQKVDLALSYRGMRDAFLDDDSVTKINEELGKQTGIISDKPLSVALDTTTRASWETGVLPHLADIPLPLVGKGEQNSVKIKLALEAAEKCEVLLMEEPENHLTHANLNKLIQHTADKSKGSQLILSTHSSFVLNKLGVDHVQMFNGNSAITLNDLSESTKAYFKKLPGYDTLRMILSKRSILVEGPSDELVVQKGYLQTHNKLPLEDEIEVISVGSLAFKRFLEIAKLLNIDTCVLTDNDEDVAAVEVKYEDYIDDDCIRICYDDDEDYPSLEQQLLKANGRERLNEILETNYDDDDSLLKHMGGNNKTNTALKIFDSPKEFAIPEYIQEAIAE